MREKDLGETDMGGKDSEETRCVTDKKFVKIRVGRRKNRGVDLLPKVMRHEE